jgi:hypothetical protein
MMVATCYQCTVRPAGNDHAGPHSAYCADCQPYDMRNPLRGPQCRCGSCGFTFANLSTFDGHRRNYKCLSPEEIGLELRAGVWGTAAGNANRDRMAARLASGAKS